MPISDYDVTKELVVASVSGTPSISKAQPIYLSGGDDSATGTGPVVLDWSGINGPSDIAVYDESGNLLDYEIERLDPANQMGVIWVYNDWVRDGTVQAQVAYGSGPEDRSMAGTGANPWDNGQNCIISQNFEDDPIAGVDSSPAGNDMTIIKGVVSVNSEVGDGCGFDGQDDWMERNRLTELSVSNPLTVVHFALTNDSDRKQTIFMNQNGAGDRVNTGFNNSGSSQIESAIYNGSNFVVQGAQSVNLGEIYHTALRWDTSSGSFYVDGSPSNTTGNANGVSVSTPLDLGRGQSSDAWLDGQIDAVRAYTEHKSDAWVIADYDASAKAGQVFFSQNGAQSTPDGVPHGVVKTDNSGVAQTDSDGVVTTG